MKMKRYAYTLAECDMNAELHEFIDAKDIADAYGKVLAVTAKLNKKNPDYVWSIKSIENAYFAGAEYEIEYAG